jgi:Fe-S-cluster containining protein
MMKPEEYLRKIDYFKKRGCVLKDAAGIEMTMVVMVPQVCENLEDGKCKIYHTRPAICREYDCRRDPYLPSGSKYEEK